MCDNELTARFSAVNVHQMKSISRKRVKESTDDQVTQ